MPNREFMKHYLIEIKKLLSESKAYMLSLNPVKERDKFIATFDKCRFFLEEYNNHVDADKRIGIFDSDV